VNSIRECKQDQRTVRDFNLRLDRLIRDVAVEAGSLRSRSLQRDDEDLAIAHDHYQQLISILKEARDHTQPRGKLVHHFQARLVMLKARVPSLFDRVFRRKLLKEAQA
tara:strand:- start:2632 stop:2955 length:324 start_codon:yes stop_codon:yes gene_type:complete